MNCNICGGLIEQQQGYQGAQPICRCYNQGMSEPRSEFNTRISLQRIESLLIANQKEMRELLKAICAEQRKEGEL